MTDDDSGTYGLRKDAEEGSQEPNRPSTPVPPPVEPVQSANRPRRKKKPRKADPRAQLDQTLEKWSRFIPIGFGAVVFLVVAGGVLWLFQDPPEINDSLLNQIGPTMSYEQATDLFADPGFFRFTDMRAAFPAVGSSGARKRGDILSESQDSALEDYTPTGGLEWSDGTEVAVLFFDAGIIAGPPYRGTLDEDGNYVAERFINEHWKARAGESELISGSDWMTDFTAFDLYLAGLDPSLNESEYGWQVPASLAGGNVSWNGIFEECDADDGDVRFSDLRLTHTEDCHISFKVAREDIPTWSMIPPDVNVTFKGTIPAGFQWITQISTSTGDPTVSNVPHGTILISDPQFDRSDSNEGDAE